MVDSLQGEIGAVRTEGKHVKQNGEEGRGGAFFKADLVYSTGEVNLIRTGDYDYRHLAKNPEGVKTQRLKHGKGMFVTDPVSAEKLKREQIT